MSSKTSNRTSAQAIVATARGNRYISEAYQVISIMVGAVIFAIGLEGFLIPNGFLDGGVVGVSILVTEAVALPMGVFIGILNIPFILLAWAMIGHRSAIRSGLGILTLSVATIFLHHMHPFTEQSWLALICGGAMIAVGIGIALRHGGALDGTEVLATILASRTNLTVGQVILYINLTIFSVAGFVLGSEAALLSAALFYVVVKDLVDQIAHGEHGARRAHVSTARYEEVAPLISDHINRPVLVDATLVEDIERIDPWANISFSDIANHHGPMFESIMGDTH